jgi:hypothetical protein
MIDLTESLVGVDSPRRAQPDRTGLALSLLWFLQPQFF